LSKVEPAGNSAAIPKQEVRAHLAREFCASHCEIKNFNLQRRESEPRGYKFYLLERSFLNSMGAYLAKPKTEKISESSENGKVRYGVSCMQGWRVTMEVSFSKFAPQNKLLHLVYRAKR